MAGTGNRQQGVCGGGRGIGALLAEWGLQKPQRD